MAHYEYKIDPAPSNSFEAQNFLNRVYYHIRNVGNPISNDNIDARVLVNSISRSIGDERRAA